MILYKNTGKEWNGEWVGEFIDLNQFSFLAGIIKLRQERILLFQYNFKKSLDDQIELFELRVDNEKRVHGFRMKSIFYLCWLDRGHKICT